MCDVTQILGKIEAGDPLAPAQLMALVYEELRKLAAAKMAQENPGQTLQATALVHEAYIRLGRTFRPDHGAPQDLAEHLTVEDSATPAEPGSEG